MLLDMQRLEQSIDSRFPPHGGAPLTQRIEGALWGYLKGQAILSTVIGTSAGVGMYILGVTGLVEGAQEYALLFGLWTAFIEVIPYIGPWLSAVPPAIFALFVDPPWGVVWVGLLFLFIYQVEGHIVVPNVMASALRLHPLLVIFGLLAGGALYGIAGVLVALPTMAGGRAIWEFFRERVQARELGRGRWRRPRRGRHRAAESGERLELVFDEIVEAAAAESPLWGEAAVPRPTSRCETGVLARSRPTGTRSGSRRSTRATSSTTAARACSPRPIATPRSCSATTCTRTGSCTSPIPVTSTAVADLAELISLCAQAVRRRDGTGGWAATRLLGVGGSRRSCDARVTAIQRSTPSRGRRRPRRRRSACCARPARRVESPRCSPRSSTSSPRREVGRRGRPRHHPLDARRRADLRRGRAARRPLPARRAQAAQERSH